MRSGWRDAFAEDTFKKAFWFNFLLSVIVYMLIVQWLKLNSTRVGTIVNDPVYGFLDPRDFSSYIFFFTYTGAIITLLYLAQYPRLLHRGLTAFAALFVVRAICIFLIPLSPSGDMVRLHDPFTNFMANEESINNDLFFSGHVADMAFFCFIVGNPWLKRILFICTVSVAVLLVWQRVHYTFDVVAAPVFAYFCYWAFVEKDIIWSPFLKKSPASKNSHSPVAE